MSRPEDTEEPLVGAAGDDVSAGISVSGVGGEKVGQGEDDQTALDEVVEGARRSAWGRRGRADGDWDGS